MNMTDHVPTLETCQKLKEVGFPQELPRGGWYYSQGKGSTEQTPFNDTPVLYVANVYPARRYCRAPILTEILEQLPAMDDSNDHLCLYKGLYQYAICYSDEEWSHRNAAEAAAQLWLELNTH